MPVPVGGWSAWAYARECARQHACARSLLANVAFPGAGLRARGPDDLRVGGATHSSPYSALFSEVVCTLGVTPPQGAAPPPPIGGNCIIRAATHRRYTARQLVMLQIPHRHQSGGCRAASKTGAGRLARKTRPAPPLHRHFREKVRPASTKTPNFGRVKRAGRTVSRFRDHTTPQGELFRAQMKPATPLLAPSRARMKPATPLLTHNAAKSSISCEQRCQRFQPTTKTGPQRCQRFQPGKALHQIGKQCTG